MKSTETVDTEKRHAVKSYLLDKSIKPRYVGFSYLENAILLSMEHPMLSIKDIFSSLMGIPWESGYHAAQYALKKTACDCSVADFVRTAASEIEIGG